MFLTEDNVKVIQLRAKVAELEADLNRKSVATYSLELEDLNARLVKLEALVARIPKCKACGEPWPEYGITTEPHGCPAAVGAS